MNTAELPQVDDPLNAAVIAAIKAEMGVQDVTATHLAHQTGIGLRNMYRYLNGETSPKIAYLGPIAEALGMTQRELLTRALDRHLEDR